MKNSILRPLTSMLGSAAALALLSGCSGATAPGDSELGTSAQALRCYDYSGNPNNTDGDCAWRDWSRLTPNNDQNVAGMQQEFAPALCGSEHGFLAVTADTGGHYHILQFDAPGVAPSWASYGNRQFVAKPSCGQREDVVNSSGQTVGAFVIAGKSTDNKIYTSAGVMGAPGPGNQGAPSEPFAAISSDTYSGGGNPTLAGSTHDRTVSAMALVVVDSNQVIWGYSRQLPYLSHSWSARVQGPKLPTGWAAVGAPAMVQLGLNYGIVVHAHNAGSHRDAFFYTYFFAVQWPPAFSAAIPGSGPATWTQWAIPLQAGQTISDDPALTADSTNGLTLWWRSNSQILETAAPNLQPPGSTPPILPAIAVKPGNTISFGSAPAALAGYTFDEGMYVVVARDSTGSPAGTGYSWFITDTNSFTGGETPGP